MEKWELAQLQMLTLEQKVELTGRKIKEFYDELDGKCYVSFSGGKDSTVLLDIARKVCPDIEVVFVDTGLEYPEIRDFVKTKENVTWLKPKKSFKQVIEQYGYPVISKQQAGYVHQIKAKDNPKVLARYTREGSKFTLHKKYRFLLNAPFKVSDKCCYALKKSPVKKYERKTGNAPITGMLAEESLDRMLAYLKGGCNVFDGNRKRSMPMGVWTEQDVLRYIKENNLPIADIYGDVVEVDGKLTTSGLNRTGCIFCMFGCHMETDEEDRFKTLKERHPKLYDYCMEKLGLRDVLNYIYEHLGINRRY